MSLGGKTYLKISLYSWRIVNIRDSLKLWQGLTTDPKL